MDQLQVQKSISKSNGLRWMDADAFLFDIDGTLLVTRDGLHRAALHRAMREVYGVDTTIDGIAYHGKTDLGILWAALERVGVSREVFVAKLPHALEVVCEHVSDNAKGIVANICAGVPELLAKLRASGKLLGVASGNLESVGWHKIQAAGLREFFSFGCFSDLRENRADIFREALRETTQRLGESASACFIGDTPEDVKAAQQVNARIIAVCTGIFRAEELLGYAPDVCVSSCAELL